MFLNEGLIAFPLLSLSKSLGNLSKSRYGTDEYLNSLHSVSKTPKNGSLPLSQHHPISDGHSHTRSTIDQGRNQEKREEYYPLR